MNDFSFSAVFKAAFNALVKNFTDIFLLSVLSVTSVLVVSLFLNSLLLSLVNCAISAAISADFAQSAAAYAKTMNPFVMFAVYMAMVLIFAALSLFFTASIFLPLCKGKTMALKNYIPSFAAVVKFIFSVIVLFAVFGCVIIALPLIAGGVSGGDGYTAGFFVVSAVSFVLLAVFVIIALKYVLFFLPLLEGCGLKDALIKSRELTKNRTMKIFVLFAVLFLINFTGKFLIFLMLITMPFSILALIYAYLELSGADLNAAGAQTAAGIESLN
jgi:hypothetical protein